MDGYSVMLPGWTPEGHLLYVSDETDWWNLYRRNADGTSVNLTPHSSEVGRPSWMFGSDVYNHTNARYVCVLEVHVLEVHMCVIFTR